MKNRSVALCLALLLLFSIVTVFSSCNDTENTESSTGYEYTPSGSEGTTAGNTDETDEQIKIDNSWRKNYYVKFSHYNPEKSISTMYYEEKRSENAFTLEYLDSAGFIRYYKADGNDTEYYEIIKNQKEQNRPVSTGESLSTLFSFFMKLSKVEPDFSTLGNVLYMYDESVAGRNCHKYIQRAYTDGALIETIYVWIDIEYGFAVKWEQYDSENKLSSMMSVESFSVGNMKDEDVVLDTSVYTFKGAVG